MMCPFFMSIAKSPESFRDNPEIKFIEVFGNFGYGSIKVEVIV